MNKEQMEKILKESLALEEKGYQWYSEGAKKIKNSLGRRMLKRLADDELTHIKRIKSIYELMTNDKLDEVQIDKPQMSVFEDIFMRMKKQMNDAIDELTEVGVDDEEIINVALELESHSRFFYEEASEKADDKVVKEFYHLLAHEEKAHYDLLQKTNQYLANPSLFFGMGNR